MSDIVIPSDKFARLYEKPVCSFRSRARGFYGGGRR